MGQVTHPIRDANNNWSGATGTTEHKDIPETNNLRVVGIFGGPLNTNSPKGQKASVYGWPAYEAWQGPTPDHKDYNKGGIEPPPGFNAEASRETYNKLYEKYNVKKGNALCEY